MKYQNKENVPLFGKYKDPYVDRRGRGKTRPAKPVPFVEPSFQRAFDAEKLYFSWLGHSSVFLHMHEQNILIDPVFSTYTSPVPFAGPRRFPGKALKQEDLPQVDLTLITHSHYDHLDRKTIRTFDKKIKKYVVPEGVGKILRRFGVAPEKIHELRWEEGICFDGLKIVCIPSQHDSGRSPLDMNRTLWGGFLLQDENYTVYDTGDGGFSDYFEKIREQYGDIDLAIMECGQYNEKWHAIHMFPEESVKACEILHAKLAIPVHWGAYVLSDHAWNDPPKRFARRAKEVGVRYRIPKIYEWVEINKKKSEKE